MTHSFFLQKYDALTRRRMKRKATSRVKFKFSPQLKKVFKVIDLVGYRRRDCYKQYALHFDEDVVY